MSGRIALMVRGLPSIPIDKAVERFGKYYKNPSSGEFHSSESFPRGYSSLEGTISFVDRQGSIEGGGGLTKEAMRDLRQLKEDFQQFSSKNPSIYDANPTTQSRAKLYSKAAGAKNLPNNWQYQVIDTRRIAEQDLPYVKAIDKAVLPINVEEILVPNQLTAFIKTGDNVIAGTRIRGAFRNAMKGDLTGIEDAIEQVRSYKSDVRNKRLLERQAVLDRNRRDFNYLRSNPSEMQAIEAWIASRGLPQLSELNASSIMEQYYPF